MEPPAVKEAPPPPQPAAEEDAMLSATAAMAKEAAVAFQGRRYADCAEVLAELLKKKEGDPKVRDSSLLSCYYSLSVGE
jgi:CCR4-NOT transcription complex subunit 10